MGTGQTDRRDEGAEPHSAPVTFHCQLQQGDVVAVGPRRPGEEEEVVTNKFISRKLTETDRAANTSRS